MRYFIFAFIFALVFLPMRSFAIEPSSIQAHAFVVRDVKRGKVLMQKNAHEQWPAASLTKLLTLLVVLDRKPNLKKTITLTLQDNSDGECDGLGDCLKADPGTAFTLNALFHAALMLSANNAAAAISRSTGLSKEEFVVRMNKKAKALGAADSHFTEPTGMDPKNFITASDYGKILSAASSNRYLRGIMELKSFKIRATNSGFTKLVKNTNKLLGKNGLTFFGAKTGYLNESQYNFASIVQYGNGPKLSVVLLGEPHLYSALEETTTIARDLALKKK